MDPSVGDSTFPTGCPLGAVIANEEVTFRLVELDFEEYWMAGQIRIYFRVCFYF
jgi:hypothetical protein